MIEPNITYPFENNSTYVKFHLWENDISVAPQKNLNYPHDKDTF